MKAMVAPGVRVSREDRKAVERWLGVWEVAAPLRPYKELAQSHGDEAERSLTKEMILDLRQPVYDSRVLFLKESPAGAALLAAWEEERQACQCEVFCGLPFLRALWRAKPLILALPAGWVKRGRR